MKLVLKDESGQTWTVFNDPSQDVCWMALKDMAAAGFPLSSLVLPDELPRLGYVADPDWAAVIALFRATGDTEEWRNAVRANEIRKVVNAT